MLPVWEYASTHVQDAVVATRGHSCSSAHTIAALSRGFMEKGNEKI